VGVRQVTFGLHDGIDDLVLPLHRHAAEIRLVADFKVKVVKIPQLLDNLARDGQLDRQEIGMLQRESLRPLAVADPLMLFTAFIGQADHSSSPYIGQNSVSSTTTPRC
jgi:hypothetical protein